MSIRVRRPQTVRLELTEGDHLLVKLDLTAGEYRDLMRASARPVMVTAGKGAGAPTMELDPVAAGVATVVAYLLDWSFCDADGRKLDIADQPADVVRSALDHIDADAYMEVQRAIQEHQAARSAAVAEEKNTDWGAYLRRDFSVCRLMGWTWDDLQNVPQPVYDELIAYLDDEQKSAARARR